MDTVPSGTDAGRNSQWPDSICTGYPPELSTAISIWLLPGNWAVAWESRWPAQFMGAQLADLAVFGARMAFANGVLAERGFILPKLEADNWAARLDSQARVK